MSIESEGMESRVWQLVYHPCGPNLKRRLSFHEHDAHDTERNGGVTALDPNDAVITEADVGDERGARRDERCTRVVETALRIRHRARRRIGLHVTVRVRILSKSLSYGLARVTLTIKKRFI